MLDLAAILSGDIATARLPILFAQRDEPLEATDSGWQFTSGAQPDPETAQVWSLKEIIAHDASLAEILDAPVGSSFERLSATSPWRVVP